MDRSSSRALGSVTQPFRTDNLLAQQQDKERNQGRCGHQAHHGHGRVIAEEAQHYGSQCAYSHLCGAHQRGGAARIPGEGSQRQRRRIGESEAEAAKKQEDAGDGREQPQPPVHRAQQKGSSYDQLANERRHNNLLAAVPAQHDAVHLACPYQTDGEEGENPAVLLLVHTEELHKQQRRA